VTENNFLPLLPDGVGNVQLPVYSLEERHLVRVDLADLEARDLTPCASRVVAVLQILGCKNERRKEHATSTLQSTKSSILRLGHGKIMLGQVSLDKDQIVQSNLQSGVAGPRSLERLLDESAKGKHSRSRRILATTLGLRQLPDDLDHLGSRILKGNKSAAEPGSGETSLLTDKAVHEVDFAFALPYQLRGTPLADGCRRSSRM
jgi:hypothetical protein